MGRNARESRNCEDKPEMSDSLDTRSPCRSPCRAAPRHPVNGQSGFSLVELMVALVLGLVLITGVVQIYLSTKAGYNLQTGMARAQENGRYAVDFITRDLRMAGDPGGCGGDLAAGYNVTVHVDTDPPTGVPDFQFAAGAILQGHEAGAGFTPPASVPFWTDPDNPTPQDAVTIVRAVGTTEQPLAATFTMANVGDNIQVAAGDFSRDDVVIISDCVQADVFAITGVTGTGPLTLFHGTASNTSANLSRAYSAADAANVSQAIDRTYYIGENPDGGPSLYRTGVEGTFEMVPDVERLELQFGSDSDGDGNVDSFADAGSVTDWAEVAAVQVDLLTRTGPEVGGGTESYAFREGGKLVTLTSDDRRLRRWYAGTIALRNVTP